MSSSDGKLSEEKTAEQDAQHETSFYNANDTDAFLPTKPTKAGSGDDDVESPGPKDDANKFSGLTREELERFSSDPMWVKIRWVLFIILLVGWVALLIAAIIIVVVEPKCPPAPDLDWYQDGVAYRLDVGKFRDSDGDSVGDIAGVEEKIAHFKDLSVKSIWMDNVLDEDDESELRASVGTLDGFKQLASSFKKEGIRVVLNLNLQTSSVDTIQDVVRQWTEAGAEGFVLSSSTDTSVLAETASSLQALLDEEFNKKDDRGRVIIGAKTLSSEAVGGFNAFVSQSNYTCDSTLSAWECKTMELASLAAANDMATSYKLGDTEEMSPWSIPVAELCSSNAVCSLTLQLTMPGTPHVRYGDEIGLTSMPRGYMVWDDSSSAGFTSNATWTVPAREVGVDSVLAQKAAGYEGTSIYSLFKDLAAVRGDEPSLMWGDFVTLDFGDDVFAFVRNATGRAPVVVALNVGDDRAGSLVFGDYSLGEVLVSSGVDIGTEESVDMGAIYLPMGSALVAKMSVPSEK